MPILIVAGNWKMNNTVQQSKELAAEMKPGLEAIAGVETVVCPPFVSLSAVAEVLKGSNIHLGAQNLNHEDKGAFTGEVSPTMLAELCRFVIVGHSERRNLFGESDGLVNSKVKAALAAGLRPILCVGEQLSDREVGRAETVVEGQVRSCLEGIEYTEALVVAYEPVWAIGTGKAATPQVAQGIMGHIRCVLGSLYGPDAASEVSLLYGGSVNPGNIGDFMQEKDVNGALVGGASLSADSFVELVQRCAHSKS